ncbi:MAG: ATP-binding cassette domain-containing protein [Candidatus Hydrogenedentota bacterium]|nr:MAG: ATP-binding cassette domain-containing protein [Candidatus Hydrogenedentota bacterium]
MIQEKLLSDLNLNDKRVIVKVKELDLKVGKKHILQNINFEVGEGDTLVLMGKNGCGKTMLLKTIVGLFYPQQGESILFGQNIYELKGVELENLKKNIGYVFQKSGLFDSLTVAENVIFALRRFSDLDESELLRRATECLNKSGLKDVEQKMPSELSGGMQKRAAIARAIAMNPKLLLLDDPTAGLDPVLSDAIADLILDLRDELKTTSIVITHDKKVARKLATKIALMISGKIHTILPAEEFFTTSDPAVEQFRDGKLEGPIPVVE